MRWFVTLTKADLSIGQAPALTAIVLMKSEAGLPIPPKVSCVKGMKLEPWAAASSIQASSLSSFPFLAA
jgi:hypothetical protein